MNWLTVTWCMVASACLTLALTYLIVWLQDRSSRVHLMFALAALGVAGVAIGELLMMLATSPQQFSTRLRWVHVPLFVAVASTVWFVRLYFHAGRLWLGWLVCILRGLGLILNFTFAPNLNFSEIAGLRHVPLFGGVEVVVAQGMVSPRTRIGELSSLLLLAYVVDASITLWRRGGETRRRRALVVGGSVVFFVLVGAGHVMLIHAGLIRWPYMISLTFLVPVAAMAYELGTDVARSGQLRRELEMRQAELRENEQQMELAAKAAGLALWRWDIRKNRFWLNAQGRPLLGLNGDEYLDLDHFLDRLVPQDRDSVRRAVMHSLDTGADYESEYRIRLHDGSTRWLAARGRVEFNGDAKPVLMRGVAYDITQRKQAEDRFRIVVEAAPNALILVNPQGQIVLTNAQTESVFGYPRHELIGRTIELLVPPRFRSTHVDDGRGHLLAPHPRAVGMSHELFGRRKDGSEIPVEVRLNPLQISEETFVLATIIDITERRNAQLEQARQRNELAHLSRVTMLGELSGSLAHELNQPLTAILSNAQAAQEFLSAPSVDLNEVREILQDIVDEDRRAGEVIRRLRLLFHKGEANYDAIDLNDLVLEVLKLMNSELVNYGVTVQTHLAPDLPRVSGDRVQIQQILINLIVNAIDAMTDTDAPERRLRVRAALDDNDNIHLSVADTGCGIPPERLEQVFEPFQTTKATGMGLGLTVCRTIISAHGGKLWADNNPDRGACFHVTLSSLPAATP